MAPVTDEAKPSAVDIVILVTAEAARGHADRFFHRFSMAGIAVQPFMGPVQFEVSLAVVVEAPYTPAIGVVAGPALCAQAPPMLIIRFVAAQAVQ